MGLINDLHDAFKAKDLDTLDKLMADDFVFVRHQSGTEVTKAEMLGWDWFKPGAPTVITKDFRVIYENDEIGVAHEFNEYPDVSKEASMGVHTIRDGQVTRLETGATPLK